jgi:Domain of unknown function (DUF222)/HNH endonuclease
MTRTARGTATKRGAAGASVGSAVAGSAVAGSAVAGSAVAGSKDPGFGSRLAGAGGALAAVVAELDPECVSGSDAVALYGRLAEVERLVLAGKALLAPRIEASGVWRDAGHPNAAALLAALEGVSPGQARATLDIGRRLADLPGTEDALRRGTLSAPKVTELTGAGALDPDREEALLAGAGDEPLAVVRERCHRSRATSSSRDPGATWRRIRAERHFSTWTDEFGAFCFRGRDTADRGAFILAAVDHLAASFRKAGRARGDETREADRAHRADALFALVTRRDPGPGAGPTPGPSTHSGSPDGSHPAGPTDPGSGSGPRRRTGPTDPPDPSDPPGPPDPPESPGGSRVRAPGRFDPDPDPDLEVDPDLDPDLDLGPDLPADRVTAAGADPEPSAPSADSLAIIDRPPACSFVVRVDLDALLRGEADEGELCEIDGQGPIPVSMARSLAEDSFLRLVFHRAGDIKAVSHQGRTINRTLRTALVHRDRTCVVPGCGMASGLEIDHVLPFSRQGPTELDNLALLCHHHHYLKTNEGWTLARVGTKADGSPQWTFSPEPPFGQEPDLGIDTVEGRRRWHQRE